MNRDRGNRRGDMQGRTVNDAVTQAAATIEHHLREAYRIATEVYVADGQDPVYGPFHAARWVLMQTAEMIGVEERVTYPMIDRLEDQMVWRRSPVGRPGQDWD